MKPTKEWKAQNTKGILRSVERVLVNGDIKQLTQAAYHHITTHMGFIAHYDLQGFCDEYRDVAHFCLRLLTSEYSNDSNYNERRASSYTNNVGCVKDYGQAYCQSVTDCNVGIIALAKKNLLRLRIERDERQRQAEISQLQTLASKHGYQVVAGSSDENS